MTAQQGEFERVAGDAIREFARSRGAAMEQYTNLLTRFGNGQIGTGAFGEETVKLALQEGVRYVQDAIKLGSAYLGYMSKVTRAADVAEKPKKVVTKTARGRGPRRAAQGRRKTSKRSRAAA